jgi:hypothetical protein
MVYTTPASSLPNKTQNSVTYFFSFAHEENSLWKRKSYKGRSPRVFS